jgi:uncharacterized SAM-binding protein YcdF (DUF218 family)
MPRAVGCFRTAGWTILPYPVDYQTTGHVEAITTLQLNRELMRMDVALREWAGLAVYAALGRTDALFPGP